MKLLYPVLMIGFMIGVAVLGVSYFYPYQGFPLASAFPQSSVSFEPQMMAITGQSGMIHVIVAQGLGRVNVVSVTKRIRHQ
jgi:hypothetical protein